MSTAKTEIAWTDRTWNCTRGCSRVSPGCFNCYAERVAYRFSGPGQPYEGLVQITNGHPQWTGKVSLIEKALLEPLSWRKPARVFVDSMSDLFYEELPDEDIALVFGSMVSAYWHTYQILTKRAVRLPEWDAFVRENYLDRLGNVHFPGQVNGTQSWPLPNVHIGVSVEDRARKDRIDFLRETPAALRFLSLEPLLEDLGTLDLRGIGWVIVGGESGPGARPFDITWARNIIAQCREAGVACFVKQVGAHVIQDGEHRVKRDKKGGDMSEWPHDLCVREFPR